MYRTLLVVLVAISLALCAPIPAFSQTAAAQSDPYSIFARARAVWSTQHYPHYLSYTIAVHVTERGVEKSRHYHLTYDAQTEAINVNPISDEEHAAPPVVKGFLWHLQPKRQHQVLFDKKVGNPGDAVDFLGVPKLAPTYSFGMKVHGGSENGPDDDALIAQIRAQFNDPMPASKDQELSTQGKLKSIASVTSRARAYTIHLAGMDTIDGTRCYHLLLQPNGNPRVLRLRQVWIDARTFETRQLVSDGNFTGSDVPWMITFGDVGGALYIASEVAQAPVGVGEHRYERASLSFESITQTSAPSPLGGSFITKQDLMTEPETQGNR
jgi:hypothetical protein